MGREVERGSGIKGRGRGRNVVSSPSALVDSQSLEGSPTSPASAPGAIIHDTTSATLQTPGGHATSSAPQPIQDSTPQVASLQSSSSPLPISFVSCPTIIFTDGEYVFFFKLSHLNLFFMLTT